ncbi:hypothetical protein CYMTET_18283 [Cymbomonas tetramitiformis]|uniref:EGF-like domain-containing protein n=1 Tax=Cymbomonas tetramitiformis TaxID=36881 RepID=A0AAE0G8L4_9CHLO|nr:hypothetical protein CYMTET_18283 [Cymbomonas tetramitiformis]
MCLPRLFTGDHDKSLAESHSYGKDFASHIDLIPEVPEENFASVDISVDNPQKSALFTSEKLADTRNFTGQNNAELDSLRDDESISGMKFQSLSSASLLTISPTARDTISAPLSAAGGASLTSSAVDQTFTTDTSLSPTYPKPALQAAQGIFSKGIRESAHITQLESAVSAPFPPPSPLRQPPTEKASPKANKRAEEHRNFVSYMNLRYHADDHSFRKKACNGRGKIEGSGGTCWCNRMFSGPQCEKGEEFTYNEQLPPRNLPAGYSGDIIMSKAGLKAGPHEIQIFLPDKDPALRTVGKAKGPLLDLVPEKDPIGSKQFKTCAVVGNSGLLLNAKHGSEIDQADMVIRFNGAPTKGIENHVGSKTTLRLVNSKPYGERGTPFGARLQPYGDGYTIYSRLQPYGDGVPFLRTLAALCPMVTGYMFTHACNPMVNGYTVYARLQPYGARALSTHACNPMVTGYPFYARLQPYGDGVHCLRTLAALW